MAADHHHGPTDGRADRGLRNRLLIAFGITALIVLTQAIGSVITGSLALLTDTAHALSDSTGLLVAVIAATMMLRPPSSKRTWGFARIEVVAALGVLFREVVVDPADGWGSDCGVVPVVIVEVQPAWQRRAALGF